MDKTKMTLDELKYIQVQILDAVNDYCVANNIRYSLGYGTLLGAARHGGYIPWDDDIDIVMPRNDYERFINSFNELNDTYKVRFNSPLDEYNLPYAKVEDTRTIQTENQNFEVEIGVNIDLFPLDYLPDNKSLRTKCLRKSVFLQNLTSIKQVKMNLHRNILKNVILGLGSVLLFPITMKWLASKIEKEANLGLTGTKEVGDVVSSSVELCYPSELIESYISMPFEGHNYMVFKDYDTYLRNTFGNYMQLPPIEKRVSTHTFTAYWK